MESLLFLMAGAILFWYFSTRKEPGSRARIIRNRMRRLGAMGCLSCGHHPDYHDPACNRPAGKLGEVCGCMDFQ
jgi:hypothetical protein